MTAPVLSVRDLKVCFRTPEGPIEVVRGVSFDLEPAQLLGMAGESGCGKSVTALALLGLLPPSVATISARRMRAGATDLLSLGPRAYRSVRGRELAMVFQDPATALDPVFRIGHQIGAAARRTRGAKDRAARAAALEALDAVGFSEPEAVFDAYPHELSGGMRQLAMIAMAVAVRPRVLLADEPTTALDVTTQTLVLQKLDELRAHWGTSILLITHDLGVIAQSAERAMIMYCGRIVERAPTGQLFAHPRHPYTAGLLAAVPRLDSPRPPATRPIPGRVPPPNQVPHGCAFAPRCEKAGDRCRERSPRLEPSGDTEVACHFPL